MTLCDSVVVKSLSVPKLSIVFGGGEDCAKMWDGLVVAGVRQESHCITKAEAAVGGECIPSGVVGDFG